MMTIEQAHEKLQRWYDEKSVGNIVVFRAPRSDYVDMICESTIKLFEMDEETKQAVRKTFELLDSAKIKLYLDKNGCPDRAKVIRRF